MADKDEETREVSPLSVERPVRSGDMYYRTRLDSVCRHPYPRPSIAYFEAEMTVHHRPARLLLVSLLTCLSGAGCHTMSNAAQGTLLGGGLGALTGGIIGHQLGYRNAGALIGAAAGGLTGAGIGKEMDVREERDAAVQYAEHLEQAIVSEGKGLTNYDLARLTASGASDDVIITAVRSHGGNFDLSPDGLIQLKSLGVSDRVILAVQQYSAAPPQLTSVAPATAPQIATHSPKKSRRPWWRRVETHDGRPVDDRGR